MFGLVCEEPAVSFAHRGTLRRPHSGLPTLTYLTPEPPLLVAHLQGLEFQGTSPRDVAPIRQDTWLCSSPSSWNPLPSSTCRNSTHASQDSPACALSRNPSLLSAPHSPVSTEHHIYDESSYHGHCSSCHQLVSSTPDCKPLGCSNGASSTWVSQGHGVMLGSGNVYAPELPLWRQVGLPSWGEQPSKQAGEELHAASFPLPLLSISA